VSRAWWWVLLLTACANPLLGLHQSRTVTFETSQVTWRWSDLDTATQGAIERALRTALPVLQRWGGLTETVTVSLLPNHEDLERVTGRHGFGWLRAFGRYDEVYLQSPRSWPTPPSEAQVAEWLTHELTHCVLFEQSGTKETWEHQGIPLWFREGMATVTARQGYRFETLEALATWQTAHPELDVYTHGEALSKEHFDAVYGLSHHAVAFFLRRYGDPALTRTMRNLRQGDPFAAAFTKAVGITPNAFTREFTTYLTLRGFRGFGLPVRAR
jgi:hypothetical protein